VKAFSLLAYHISSLDVAYSIYVTADNEIVVNLHQAWRLVRSASSSPGWKRTI